MYGRPQEHIKWDRAIGSCHFLISFLLSFHFLSLLERSCRSIVDLTEECHWRPGGLSAVLGINKWKIIKDRELLITLNQTEVSVWATVGHCHQKSYLSAMHAQWKCDMRAYEHLKRHDRLITAWLHTFDEVKCVFGCFWGHFPSIFVNDFDDGCHGDKTWAGVWEDVIHWHDMSSKKKSYLVIITWKESKWRIATASFCFPQQADMFLNEGVCWLSITCESWNCTFI